jgi:trehalose monomycolate/heme transporter
MLAALGRFAVDHRRAILAVYLSIVPFAIWFGAPVIQMLEVGGFEDPQAESWKVRKRLVSTIGVGSPDVIVLYENPGGTVDDVEMLTGVLTAIEEAKKDPAVVHALSYYTTGAERLVSTDRTSTFVVVTMKGDDQEKEDAFDRLRPLMRVPGIQTRYAGFIPVNQVLQATIEADVRRAEMIAFPITAILLVLIFGSLASASLPLAVGGLSVLFAFLLMRIMTMFTDLSLFAANVVTVLGLGLAIDYSLFIVNRYREELPKRGVREAVVRTMATTGRAVAFSGVTVALSLMGLLFFPQMYLRSMAYGGIAVVLCSLTLAMTLLPALLATLGDKIDALRVPFAPKVLAAHEESGFWHALAFGVMKRPVLVAVAVILPLLLLGTPFLRLDPSVPDHKILPRGSEPREAAEVVDAKFLQHQTSPLDVIVQTPGPVLARENLEALWALHQAFENVPGVAVVDSPFSPLRTVGKERLFDVLAKPHDQQDPNVQAALDVLVKDNVIRFGVISTHEFYKPISLDQVRLIRALPEPPGFSVQVGGIGAILYDLKEGIRTGAPLMVGFVALSMFIVLFLVFGSITLPIKAMIMNSLSLTASFGAIVYVFQDGRFSELLHYEPLYITDVTAPLLMFAVVFGLSMDYEVLLLARVREEYLRTGDNTLSVARGLARTGRLITSAAALLVAVIIAFATSRIIFLKALGVGMALAIALDATVIRALLVPAAMRLMGEWNWYAPAFLKRLWERAGFSDLEGYFDDVSKPPEPPR